MDVIALIGQKGGTGKTTLAQCLAVASARRHRRAYIIDLDPQGTAAAWFDRREQRGSMLHVATAAPGRLANAIETARSVGARTVLIDTPGNLEGPAVAAVRQATMVLIPMRPQINDLDTLEASRSLVMVGGSLMRCEAVICAAPVAGRRHIEAGRFAAGIDLVVCPHVIHQRAAYADAPSLGLGAQEYDPQGKAADEVRNLHDHLQRRLRQLRGETHP